MKGIQSRRKYIEVWEKSWEYKMKALRKSLKIPKGI